jgi:hypothetical protein
VNILTALAKALPAGRIILVVRGGAVVSIAFEPNAPKVSR